MSHNFFRRKRGANKSICHATVTPVNNDCSIRRDNQIRIQRILLQLDIYLGVSAFRDVHLPNVHVSIRVIRQIVLYLSQRPIPPLRHKTSVAGIRRESRQLTKLSGSIALYHRSIIVVKYNLSVGRWAASTSGHIHHHRRICRTGRRCIRPVISNRQRRNSYAAWYVDNDFC